MLLSLLPNGLAWLGGGGSNVHLWAAPPGIGDSWWDLLISFGLPLADGDMCILLCSLHHRGLDKTVAVNLTYHLRPVFWLVGIWGSLEHISLELQLEATTFLYHFVFSCCLSIVWQGSVHSIRVSVFTSDFLPLALDKGYTWLPSETRQKEWYQQIYASPFLMLLAKLTSITS